MRYLVIGYGNVGAKRKSILGKRCAATADPFQEAADYRNWEDFSSASYDAAILAVPNDQKLRLLERLLRLGKHVLVEKPLLFPDERVAEDVARLARENRAIWYTSYNHRFEPQVEALRKELLAGTLGEIYHARLFYGNGTVRNIMGSWREDGYGVLEDLGCHLLDLAAWLFSSRDRKFVPRELRRIESKTFDRSVLATEEGDLVLESSYVSWKNSFRIDVHGEKGSMHLDGLTKWGPSELVVRRRVYPSGVPEESRTVAEGPDVSWERDLEEFERHVASGTSTFENDLWISRVVHSAAAASRGESAAPCPPAPAEVRPGSLAPAGFLGLSHLGAVASAGWASLGNPVVAVDPDARIVETFGKAKSPYPEPGLEELIRQCETRLLHTTEPSRLQGCSLVFVTRDVPTDENNASDTTKIEELVRLAVPHLAPGVVIVLMSQVEPGFTRKLADRIRSWRPELAFEMYYWVETLVLGNAVERFLKPERIILGCRDPGAPLPRVLEQGLAKLQAPILRMRYESAELAKTAINLYLAGSVTYANTLSDLCEAIGADWSEVAPALRMDKRIGAHAYLRPSLGIAGGNLERDLVTLRDLCARQGVDSAFLRTVLDYNRTRYRWVHRMLEQHVFSHSKFPTIAVWGLAYKKNTSSTKNSFALRVLSDLRGRAFVKAYDPAVKRLEGDPEATLVDDRHRALEGADCLLVLADWDEFADVDGGAPFQAMKAPVVIDCVGVLEKRGSKLGQVRYVSMGRGEGEP